MEALRTLPRHVRSEFVFVNPNTGRPWVNVRRMWRRACKAAGLAEGTWFHDTRRGPGVGEARYLGVREFARLLGVSTATVYKAVGRGELRAVRVSSVIRILVSPGLEADAAHRPASAPALP